VRCLEKRGRPDIRVVVGGVVPENDFNLLREAGVHEIFGPATSIPEAARTLLEGLMEEEDVS
ncbi:MAG: hypothetical protein WD205_09420, partial [Rhodothermales bacterium]